MRDSIVFLSRHGIREDWGPGRQEWLKTAPRPLDPSLAAEGFSQAQELASFYSSLLSPSLSSPSLSSSSSSSSSLSFDFILASPLVRTLQTATAIADALNMPICVEYGAMEWVGGHTMPVPLPIVDLPPTLDEAGLHTWCGNAMRSIATRFTGKTIIVVTHAAPLIALARGLMGPDQLIRTGVCSVTKLALYNQNNNQINNDNNNNGNIGKIQQVDGEVEVEKEKEEERKKGWVVEMDGSCTHLSKGEQFHWTFGL